MYLHVQRRRKAEEKGEEEERKIAPTEYYLVITRKTAYTARDTQQTYKVQIESKEGEHGY